MADTAREFADARRLRSIERIEGEVLTHNSRMLGLAHSRGYDVRRHPESALFLHASLPLLLPVEEQGCSPLVKLANGAKAHAAAATA